MRRPRLLPDARIGGRARHLGCVAALFLASCAPADSEGPSAGPGAAAPWAPPLGIPAPSFGVGERGAPVPSPWTTETAGFYFVDGERGTDEGRTYGTASAPRATIPNPVPAGAVVRLEGVYREDHTGARRLRLAGTAARPCFVQGAAGTRVTGSWEIGGSYGIVETLTFGPGGGWTVLAPADHIAVRDSEFIGTLEGEGGISVQAWIPDADATDIVLLRNNVHHAGDWQASFDQDSHGTGLYRSSGIRGDRASISNVWILDSEYSYNSGDGVQINANDDSERIHHVYIGRNESHHNKQSGFGLKWASDVVFSENQVYGHASSDSADGPGMGLQYDPQRVWYLFNESYDNTHGFWHGSGDAGGRAGIYYIGNMIHDNTATGMQLNDWVDGEYIIGNTFHNNPIGIENGYYRVGLEISDNIFSRSRTAHVSFREYGSGAASSVRHCLFDAPARIVWDDVAVDVAGLQGLDECGGCRSGDPRFVNAAAGDFNLKSGSPAIDGGVAEAAYVLYERLYSVDIRKDKTGRPRPQGTAWDIGAFESSAQP
jgi:hypothetical protein